MKTIFFILRKEFRQIFRDPAILRLIFIMPAMQLILLPFAADYEMKNVKLCIVDQDMTSTSRMLSNHFAFSKYFQVVKQTTSYKSGLAWIEDESVDLVLQIPHDFEKRLVRQGTATLFVAVNAVNGTKGNLGAAYTQSVIRQYNQSLQIHVSSEDVARIPPLVRAETRAWYNPLHDYQNFMVPGILAILLTMTGAFLSALNIVREKELGTIEQLNVTPVRRLHFILGKMIPFWLIGLVGLTIGLLVSFVVHGIVPGSNVWMIYMFSAVYLLAVLGLGLMISNFTSTQQQAMMVSFFFILIFVLMSGLYTPIESMPAWGQVVAYCNPVTYMIQVMRMLLLKGADFSDIWPQFRAVLGFALLFNSFAVLTYQKRST